MSETLLRDLWMNASDQELRCVAMPKIVQPDTRHVANPLDGLLEFVRQAPRRHRFTVRTSTDQRVGALPHSGREKFLSLFSPQPLQLHNCKGRQGDRPCLLVLWCLEAESGLGLLEALNHTKTAPVEIDIPPPKGEDLAAPGSGSERD